jgi:hypothetical protein
MDRVQESLKVPSALRVIHAGHGYGTVPRGTTHCTGWPVSFAMRS